MYHDQLHDSFNLFFENLGFSKVNYPPQFSVKKMKKFIDFTTKKMEALKAKPPILVAISGGQDSCATFFLCLHLEKWATLEVVYCNHFWQPKNFLSSGLIFQLSFLFVVPYTLILPQNIVLGENRSRGWRKKSFCRLSHLKKILFTITGHTRTDTFEKNLNHLFRGTSPKGLTDSTLLISEKSTGLFFSTQIFKPTVLLLKQFLVFHHPIQENKNTLYSKKNTNQLVQKCIWSASSKKYIFLAGPLAEGKGRARKLKNQFHFSKPKDSENSFLFRRSGLKKDHHKKIYYFFEKITSSSFCVSAERHTIQLNCFKPLENIGRSTVSKLLCLYEFPVITDVTNFSSNFSRNKIRHHLGPFIQSFLQKKTDYRLTQFFKILNQEHYEVQKELFFLYCLALLAKSEFTEKTKTTNKRFLQPFLSTTLSQFMGIGLKKSLLHKFFSDYKDIELSFLQICTLQFFICRKD